jgi:hypothetical protein
LDDPTTLATLQIVKKNIGLKFGAFLHMLRLGYSLAYIPIFQNVLGAKHGKLEA